MEKLEELRQVKRGEGIQGLWKGNLRPEVKEIFEKAKEVLEKDQKE